MNIGNFSLNSTRTLIIAELSANHGNDIEIAKKTIRAAKRAGADAIKLQTYTADTLTLNCDKEDFIVKGGTLWDNKTLYALYQEAYTPWEWHKELFEVAKEERLLCFSTPFDRSAVDFLETLNPPAYKVASFEVTDYELVRYIASKHKPIIIPQELPPYERSKMWLLYAKKRETTTLCYCNVPPLTLPHWKVRTSLRYQILPNVLV